MQRNECDVVVVGLGAMGAATIYQLAKRGINVIGIDRFSPPHDQGSSHGDTRITRRSAGEGPAYLPLVSRSHQIWRELEKQTGEQLFEECGVVVMSSTESTTLHHGRTDFVDTTIALAEGAGISHEVLSGEALAERFPQFALLGPQTRAYFEPGGGYVRPEQCIAAQLHEARRLGATLFLGSPVLEIREHEAAAGDVAGGVEVRTADRIIVAKRAIVSAGMWNPGLLGEPFEKYLRVCRQTLYWFALDKPEIFPSPSPSFILSHGSEATDFCYGFPPLPGENTMKIASEQYVETSTPDTLRREVSAGEAEEMYRNHVAGKIDGVSPRLVKSSVCTYTLTPDFDFIIDNHPTLANVTVVSACSGHGFKHSAGIGEALAQRTVNDLVPGTEAPSFDLSAFSYDRLLA